MRVGGTTTESESEAKLTVAVDLALRVANARRVRREAVADAIRVQGIGTAVLVAIQRNASIKV